VPTPASTNEDDTNNNNEGGNNQKLILFKRGKDISQAPIKIGTPITKAAYCSRHDKKKYH
jgi:hypothetical protein